MEEIDIMRGKMEETDVMDEKWERLKEYLKKTGSIAVAFSSGVDSAFLLKTAHDVLGGNAVAVTACSCSFPKRELDEAVAFCKERGIEQILVETDELSIEGFRQNPPNRCYLCKRALLKRIQEAAARRGISCVAEGSNTDDEGDYRPGMRAIAELGIKSPLRKAGLSKAEIRILSRRLGLPTWDKPSFACLASRFAYGEAITKEKLSMVEQAEQWLFARGFRQIRVRIHENLARIEIEKTEFEKILAPEIRNPLTQYFHELGFLYVTLDLDGYQMGSMNKGLNIKK